MSLIHLIEEATKSSQKRRNAEMIKDVAIATALGITVGAAAGVLLAPKAGKETREELVKAARELPAKVKEAVERKEVSINIVE